MKLEKAIEKLHQLKTGCDKDVMQKYIDALQLGIEAMKRVKWHKEQHLPSYYEPLPGETKEKRKED